MSTQVGAAAVPKAAGDDFLGRFREIVADPLNLLIHRTPRAGVVDGQMVCLHNGLRVPFEGEGAYYGRFSEILVINRGVHEPLEEFAFQEMLPALGEAPCMLELGAYWGHYSMWLKQRRPAASVHLVEPDPLRLAVGRANFERNGFSGNFLQGFVGRGQFTVDRYLSEQGIARLDILHADIQGYEVEMLEGADETLSHGAIDRVFVSTHSQRLHMDVVAALRRHGMRIELDADFDTGTTSFDGFVYAARPGIAPIVPVSSPLGRTQINGAGPTQLVEYVSSIQRALRPSTTSPSP